MFGVSPLFVTGYEAPELKLDDMPSFVDARKEGALKEKCKQLGAKYKGPCENETSDMKEAR